MKGIILAGGKGTRMLPATEVMNKHMMPILNTPMIVYPLRTLKFFNINNILVISGGNHIGQIAEYLGDGSRYGVDLTYKVQKEAGGIAEALGLSKDFAGDDGVMVILGDNIFDNSKIMNIPISLDEANIFVTSVRDPQRFGVYTDGENGPFIAEKPSLPASDLVVTGLYYYPSEVFEVIKNLTPSLRGELEITDVNNHFLQTKEMVVNRFDGFWSDAGTPKSMLEVINWAGSNLK